MAVIVMVAASVAIWVALNWSVVFDHPSPTPAKPILKLSRL